MTSAFVECHNQMKSGEIREALTDARESHEGGSVLRRGHLEVTLIVLEATSQKGTSQNEEQVRKDGSE